MGDEVRARIERLREGLVVLGAKYIRNLIRASFPEHILPSGIQVNIRHGRSFPRPQISSDYEELQLDVVQVSERHELRFRVWTCLDTTSGHTVFSQSVDKALKRWPIMDTE
jgi:hypothetical protein